MKHHFIKTLEAYGITEAEYILAGSCSLWQLGMDIHPNDLDVVLAPSAVDKIMKFSNHESDMDGGMVAIIPDENVVETHSKNKAEGISTQNEFDDFKANKAMCIDGIWVVKPEITLKHYQDLKRGERDREKIDFLCNLVQTTKTSN